ncbi:MAG TPA: hypothetical protein EYG51_06130 [Pseudomonadales bacterium]|nr:hypothetical protein [Pseudomonadales bacterium]
MVKQFKKKWVILVMVLGVCNALGETPFNDRNTFLEPSEILPVEDAFRLTAARSGDEVMLYWQITPGYYLYKHRLKATSEVALGALFMSPGQAKHDEFFGDVEVYYDELEVIVPILSERAEGSLSERAEGSLSERAEGSLSDQAMTLMVEYQGCADAGICYPPQKVLVSP